MKPNAVLDTTPEIVQDFELLPPRGTTRYELVLADEHVELLAQGVCPEAVSRRAYKMLEWKRTNARVLARTFRVRHAD